jgi:hypothetical protein
MTPTNLPRSESLNSHNNIVSDTTIGIIAGCATFLVKQIASRYTH